MKIKSTEIESNYLFFFLFTEWFDEYSECPVSGCHCKCNSHDMDTSNTDSSSNKKKLIEDSSTEIEFFNDQQP